jgi:hypothetical protein
MLKEDFCNWLLVKKYDNTRTIGSRTANCARVCEYEGDLDEHYAKDACEALIKSLSYSAEDERLKRPQKHKIPIDGNVRNGTATLKQAVRLYAKFKDAIKDDDTLISRISLQAQTMKEKKPTLTVKMNGKLYSVNKEYFETLTSMSSEQKKEVLLQHSDTKPVQEDIFELL